MGKMGYKDMEFIEKNDIKELANPGVVSRQLLNTENSRGSWISK